MTNYVSDIYDFELRDMENVTVKLSELLAEKPVLLVFFKHDCPTCRFTLPFIQRLYDRYSDDYACFLGIAQDNRQDTVNIVSELDLDFKIVMEPPPYDVSRRYELGSVPTVILINSDGAEISRFMGFQKGELEKLNYILPGLSAKELPLFAVDDDVPNVKPG
jgi:peroxiredoxin